VARAAADEAVSGGKIIIGGFAIGFIYYGLLQIFKAMKEIPEKVFGKPFEGASISLENNPALLGVGLHHRPAYLSAHDGWRGLVLPRPHPRDQILSAPPEHCRWRQKLGTASPTCRSTKFSIATFYTSAQEPSPQQALSVSFAPCRSSGMD
jgi:hypothetical protein